MKKLAAFIFALLISLSFHADARLVSGTAQHQHDSSTGGGSVLSGTTINTPTINNAVSINVNGAVSSDKACADGYTRLTPNYCMRTGGAITVDGKSYSTVCQITTALAGVTNAKAILVAAEIPVFSGNGAGILRYNYLNIYDSTDTGCATLLFAIAARSLEEVACLNCILSERSITLIIPTNTSGQYRHNVSAAPVALVSDHIVLGYYD